MATQVPMTEAERKEQKRLEEILEKIHYSDRYTDDFYEYRHVILPKALFRMIPSEYFNTPDDRHGPLRLLADDEWRAIGIQQSMGWEHYEVHAPEPHVLLFRRPKDFVAPKQPAPRQKEAARRKL